VTVQCSTVQGSEELVGELVSHRTAVQSLLEAGR
jgi:hypothetical protein